MTNPVPCTFLVTCTTFTVLDPGHCLVRDDKEALCGDAAQAGRLLSGNVPLLAHGNGLFLNTQGSGTWNKFSIVDMCVAWIVAELTSRGVGAQTAESAATAATPALATLCDYGKDAEEDEFSEIVHQIWFRIAERADSREWSVPLVKPWR
ncbi:hypothetical protein AOQ72_12210 [Bradyrhizobium yuanmingense]|uniref:Uncharacterized protein n=1 Tax=Bradyrhizobium yuanmingense TaxID=108015 RepID=A0A0R3CV24_9BRAD|nr:hypothetical protein AOQ72_12210 [Bradyrhizobium yuanmingense]